MMSGYTGDLPYINANYYLNKRGYLCLGPHLHDRIRGLVQDKGHLFTITGIGYHHDDDFRGYYKLSAIGAAYHLSCIKSAIIERDRIILCEEYGHDYSVLYPYDDHIVIHYGDTREVWSKTIFRYNGWQQMLCEYIGMRFDSNFADVTIVTAD